MTFKSGPGYSGFSSGPGGQAYNQTAFRHFLAIERRRAESSMQSVLLVLVTVRTGREARLADATSAAIFRGLGETVREIDFVGWFREGRVAGAVLPQSTAIALEATGRLMLERVRHAITSHLPAALTRDLRVRVVPFVPRSQSAQQSEPMARALSGY